VSVSSSVEPLALKGASHGIAGYVVDGMNPVAVYKAMEIARAHALGKPGAPVMVEAQTYRYYHQAQSLPGSAFGYRTKEEEELWRGRDPCLRFPEELVAARVLTEAQVRALEEEAKAIVARALERLTESAGASGATATSLKGPCSASGPTSPPCRARSSSTSFPR
jgi:2-oxoisovalerate dehydrogenase E1 component